MVRIATRLEGHRSRISLFDVVLIGIGVVAVACGTNQTPLQDEARQIVGQQQHVAAVQTMTSLLQQQQAAENQGTMVALNTQMTATSVAGGVQYTATAANVSIAGTSTARSAEIAVQQTQAPIIAAATVAAAQDAANIQATAIVDAAVRAATLATQETATAEIDAAQAQANAETERASYAAWEQRRDAAAKYVGSCTGAASIASGTTSLPAAIASAQAFQYNPPIGTCTTPTPPLLLSSAATSTASDAPPSPSLQAAIARIKQEGYDVADGRDYDGPFALHVLIGVKVPTADGYTQRAFFFSQDRYIGTDAMNPSAGIELSWRDADTVALRYTLYRKDDAMCCPTGGAATVRFQWDGSKLTPLDPIPPDDLRAALSRR